MGTCPSASRDAERTDKWVRLGEHEMTLTSRLIWVACLTSAGVAVAAKGTTVVTLPGETDAPTGFFSAAPTVIHFDALAPDGGIPTGISLTAGVLSDPATSPFPGDVDYALESPSTSVWGLAPPEIIFDFAPAVSPAEVGVVFTDSGRWPQNVTLEAWDGPGATGTMLASVTALRGDSTVVRSFGEDCFFGIGGLGKIASIRLWHDNASEGIELDMLRFNVPEPATLSLLALGGLVVTRRRH